MTEAEIRFEEGREGLIPVGSYLIDAAKRYGAIEDADCLDLGEHCCKFQISTGGEFLSAIGNDEATVLTDDDRKGNLRVGCFAKIERPGVIEAMAEKKKQSTPKDEAQAESREENYRKEFAELPLEKKIANLVHLEAMALGETLAFVINSPFKVFEKVGDVLAEFGFQKEADEKQRARPAEAKTNGAKSAPKKANPAESKTEKEDQQSP